MLKNLKIPLDITVSYLENKYTYYEDFKPYKLGLVKELLENSYLNEIVKYLEKNVEQQPEELAESIGCDIDYYFDLFSVLKIFDSSKSDSDLTEVRSYIQETEKIQSNIIFEKIKLSLIPYFDIVTKKEKSDEKIEQYFEYLTRKIYDYSKEENTFLDYDFKNEKFNTMVRNIDLIFKENTYERTDKATTIPIRNKINKELFLYINNLEDSSVRYKVDYIKTVLLLSTNGFRPRFIDRYKIAICGLNENDANKIIYNIGFASSKRISKLFLYYNNSQQRRIKVPSINSNSIYIAITQKVTPYLKDELSRRCFGLLLSDNSNYYSLSGIWTDKPAGTTSDKHAVNVLQLVGNIEKILKAKFPNIQRSVLSPDQITFYDIYSNNKIPEPYFMYTKPLQKHMTLFQFTKNHGIKDIFANNGNTSFFRCFSCCEPKLLVDSQKTKDKFILYVKKTPCDNCQLIIPVYKNKLKSVIYYDEKLEKIEEFTI